jgi:TolB-like protein/Flp pilus assembly protein TadD
MPLEPGTRLGPYEIVELRGKGGMGEVYRSRDTRLDREVAVKVLPAELSADEAFRRRFEREAKTLSRLQHPHVCTLHDLGEAEGRHYLVLEYLEGETLEERLRSGPLPVAEAVRIGEQIAAGVAAAHAEKVVHRDLKPGNVLLTAHGVKVVDFGLAREAAGAVDTRAETAPVLTREGAVVGTLPYMAPEQVEGRATDHRSDVWALGCVLYEMVSGRRPFAGASDAGTVGAILEREPPRLEAAGERVPTGLEAVVGRCLEKSPAARFQAVAEVEAALGEVKARADAVGRRRSTVALAVAAVLVSVLGVALWRSGPGEGSDRPTTADAGQSGLALPPFENLSGEPELDALSVGIPAALVANEPNWMSTMEPMPAASAEEACAAAVGAGAEQVLRGTLLQVSDRVRVSARFFDCDPTVEVLWSGTYEGDVGQLLALHDEVVEAIRLEIGQISNFDGFYENPGSARWHVGRLTREDNERALAMIRAGEPGTLGEALQQALTEGWADPPETAIEEFAEEAQQCVGEAPRFWACHFQVAWVRAVEGDLRAAIAAARRTLELPGGDIALVRADLARYLALAGETEEAVEILEELLEASPGNPMAAHWWQYLGVAHFAEGRYATARDAAQRAIETDSNTPWNALAFAWQDVAVSAALLGDLDEARAALEEARKLRPALSLEVVEVFYGAAQPGHWRRYLEGLRLAGFGGSTGAAPVEPGDGALSARETALPFENLEADPELERLALGLWEELLARNEGTVDREALRDLDRGDACAAAAAAGRRWVRTGSLRRDGSRVRIRAELWDCPDRQRLWGDTYDRELDDLLSLQDEIVGRILTTSAEAADTSRYSNQEGTTQWWIGRRTREANVEARHRIRAALAESPADTEPHNEMVLASMQTLLEGWAENPEDVVAEMRRAVSDCRRVDPTSCHYETGFTELFGGDGQKMLAAFQRLQSQSGLPDTYDYVALALIRVGRPDEAVPLIEEAMRMSPEDSAMQRWIARLASAHFTARGYEEARDAARECIAFNESDPWGVLARCYQTLAASLAWLGDEQAARDAMARAREDRPALTLEVALLPHAASSEEQREHYAEGLRRAGLE